MSAPQYLTYGARKWRWLCAHMAVAHREVPRHTTSKLHIKHGRAAVKHGHLKRIK